MQVRLHIAPSVNASRLRDLRAQLDGGQLNARGCFLMRALPHCKDHRLNALPMVEFALPILVEPGSIAISFGHAPTLAGTGKSLCALRHMPAAANP